MKHILIFLALSIATLVNAEEFLLKKEVQCDKTDEMIAILKGEKFEEVPIWLGKGDAKAPNYSLFVNSETRTWTIIQFNKEYSCVLGAGESYNLIIKKPYT